MTHKQVKDVLRLQRAGRVDTSNAEVVEALRLVVAEPGLRAWWEEHQQFDRGIRAAMESLPIPGELEADILARRTPSRVVQLPGRRRRIWAWAAAAAAVLALIVGSVFWGRGAKTSEWDTFRNRMARAALREYRMTLTTNDLGVIRGYLAQAGAPAGYELPAGVQRLPGLGCGVVRWQDRPVSMVCFDLGRNRILWLFVAELASVPGAPAASEKRAETWGRLATTAWSDGRHVYLLAMVGEPGELRPYLGPGNPSTRPGSG